MNREEDQNAKVEGTDIPRGQNGRSEEGPVVGRERGEVRNERYCCNKEEEEEGKQAEGMDHNWDVGMEKEHEEGNHRDCCKGMKKMNCNCPFDLHQFY